MFTYRGTMISETAQKIIATQDYQPGLGEEPVALLRATALKLRNEMKKLNDTFSAAIANISERSNLHTQIARLPEELVLSVFTHASEASPNIGFRRLVYPYSSDPPRSFSQWAILLKVSWSNTVRDFPRAWTSIDMSWPAFAIENHSRLSKTTPLRIWWDDMDKQATAASRWITDRMQSVEYLHLATGQVPLWDAEHVAVERFLSESLSSHARKLRTLRVMMGTPSDCRIPISLPDLAELNISHLRLQHSWCNECFPPRLQTLYVRITSAVVHVTTREIYEILVDCPLLESCEFDISGDAPESWRSLAETSEIPIRLPHLRTLGLGLFPSSHIDWIYERIVPDILASVSISTPSELDEVMPFSIPSRLHDHCSRAYSLRISGPEIVYQLHDQFKHSIEQTYDHWTSPEIFPDFASVITLFGSLQQLIIDHYIPSHHTAFVLALRSLNHLSDLRLRGCQTNLVNLLPDLCEREPLVCQKLQSLTLKDNRDWSWGMTPDDPVYITGKKVARGRLEKLLKLRLEQDIPLQNLVLSEGDWWADDLGEWRQLVGGVVDVVRSRDAW
ncbi:hypothetical protein SISNIDRAFT_487472 [Sistotremastrum niveocremeum HHB9708]|uniref:F-box domain-containing protein n=1 Tax=Sistotremastrum niveocremeum HHB9708 TaxID=1314777 RepID=A0A164SI01_9AGAM|nr:hypothetical protein SISNIDRAFT_487472 [Sistotremastrum niveocremeum HHB9708]